MENSSEARLAELLTLRKVVDSSGNILYFNNDNQLHRVHGPAVINCVGTEYWCCYGIKHRIGGPAVMWRNGNKEWWENGRYIRREPR